MLASHTLTGMSFFKILKQANALFSHALLIQMTSAQLIGQTANFSSLQRPFHSHSKPNKMSIKDTV